MKQLAPAAAVVSALLLGAAGVWAQSAESTEADVPAKPRWLAYIHDEEFLSQCAKQPTEPELEACIDKALAGLERDGWAVLSGRMTERQRIYKEAPIRAAREKAAKAAVERALKACKTRRWTDGEVHLGMSSEQVVVCGWGAPEWIRSTSTATREVRHWFYLGDRSITLENDRVVIINQ